MGSFIVSLICFLAGGALFLSMPFIAHQEINRFSGVEKYFAAPVPLVEGGLFLREDSYGKGYFGASRNGGRTHKGVDLMLDMGRPVYASKSGRISISSYDKGYGHYLQILHPDGFETLYAHLLSIDAAEGEWVEKGRIIGFGGNSGNANDPRIKPHLHFEIRQNGIAVDPARFIDPRIRLNKS